MAARNAAVHIALHDVIAEDHVEMPNFAARGRLIAHALPYKPITLRVTVNTASVMMM